MQIKAFELMTLAAADPQKYEGKRYRVVDGCVTHICGKHYDVVEVQRDVLPNTIITLVGVDKDGDVSCDVVSITSRTILEEIKPEPKPVSFKEAVAALAFNKTIRCKLSNGLEFTYAPFYGMLKLPNGKAVTTKQILEGTWYIKED